jgi:hypothetical protein
MIAIPGNLCFQVQHAAPMLASDRPKLCSMLTGVGDLAPLWTVEFNTRTDVAPKQQVELLLDFLLKQ